jgi:hypothetical protein
MEANLNPAVRLPAAARHRRAAPPAAHASGAFADTLVRAKRTARRMRARRESAVVASSAVLDAPPPEVEREMAAAARASQTLAAEGKELRFDVSPDGRVLVELVDVGGQPLDLTPAGLFQLLSQAR